MRMGTRSWRKGSAAARRPRSPIALMLLVCAGMLACFGWNVWTGRALQIDIARKDTANLARSLADQAEVTVKMADLVLVGLVERLETDGTGPPSLKRLAGVMQDRIQHWDRLGQVAAFGRDGRLLAGSHPDWTPSIAGEAFFAHHASHADAGPHIGAPVQDRLGPGWRLVVSRRFLDSEGQFAGVALATIELGLFRSLYRTFDIGPDGSIALVGTEGNLLVRSRGEDDLTGLDLSQTAFYQSYRQIGHAGQMQFVSPVDGIARQTSYRPIGAYPMVIFVALSTRDVLAEWWRTTLRDGAVVTTLVLATALLGLWLSRQMRRHHKSEAAARASEAMYRLLADSSTDVVVKLGPDLCATYVSPASAEVFGFPPHCLMGRQAPARIHRADWPGVARALQDLRHQPNPVSTIMFRWVRRGGAVVWMEASIRWLDRDDGFVVAVRDISRRVAAEQSLHDANHQLQKLVLQDGLTGIANRRSFDAALEREFRRGLRDGAPLSVLMIDADRFKSFNDSYGHQAGDACLRAIAQVLGGSMRRPADLAARYGGEEFVLLLPDTDAAGAAETAERIRAAIEATAIIHAGNAPGVVTVSVGVASGVPGMTADSTAALLTAADAALYGAKTAGRNRVLCADRAAAPRVAEPVA